MKAPDQTVTKIAAVAPKRELERRDTTPMEVTLSFDDNRLASVVFGHYDQNIARIERRLGVTANANGNHCDQNEGPRQIRHRSAVHQLRAGASGHAGVLSRVVRQSRPKARSTPNGRGC